MNKSIWKIAKVNLQNIKIPFLTAGIIAGTMLLQTLIYIIISISNGGAFDSSNVSIGCVLWLAPLMAAIFIPAANFSKIINLGGKRDNFIWGSLIVYILMAFFGALANTVIYFTLDRFIQTSGYFSEGLYHGVMNLVEIFGWTKNGSIIAFVQQFAFLFMVVVIIHTLTSIQDKWYGWVTDVVLVAIIAVFTPIAPLRSILSGFFNLIIFQSNAYLQISICLLIAIVIYSLSKPIFARKII